MLGLIFLVVVGDSGQTEGGWRRTLPRPATSNVGGNHRHSSDTGDVRMYGNPPAFLQNAPDVRLLAGSSCDRARSSKQLLANVAETQSLKE